MFLSIVKYFQGFFTGAVKGIFTGAFFKFMQQPQYSDLES